MYQSLSMHITGQPEPFMMYESRLGTRVVMPCQGSTSMIAPEHRQNVHVCRKLTNGLKPADTSNMAL